MRGTKVLKDMKCDYSKTKAICFLLTSASLDCSLLSSVWLQNTFAEKRNVLSHKCRLPRPRMTKLSVHKTADGAVEKSHRFDLSANRLPFDIVDSSHNMAVAIGSTRFPWRTGKSLGRWDTSTFKFGTCGRERVTVRGCMCLTTGDSVIAWLTCLRDARACCMQCGPSTWAMESVS